MEATIHIDDARRELLIARVQQVTRLPDVLAMMAGLEAYLERGASFAFLIDTRAEKEPPPPAARKRFVEFINEKRPALKESCVGFAFVLPSVLARMAFRGAFLVFNPPVPFQVYKEYDEAIGWCEERLSKAREGAR